MSQLFSALTLRGTTFKNRIWVSPMCEYSALDGVPNDWHLVHLGSRAVGGAGLVVTEATAVTAEGRISPDDTGIWNDRQTESWARINHFIRSNGSLPGIQLAHAGRKASTFSPWKGRDSVPLADGGWNAIAPSAIPFGRYATPTAMTSEQLVETKNAFVDATRRAHAADFEVIEVHAAHGYLLHQFLSPLSNQRDDQYGGDFEGRVRYPLEVIDAVRTEWPENKPLLLRISATDWYEGGWNVEQSQALAKLVKDHGVDLIDTSSGGLVPEQQITVGPGYQVPFAAAVKETGIATGAVGLITDARQAEAILVEQKADVVFLARQLLRDPYFPLHAAAELGEDIKWPVQYDRAK